MEITGDHRRSFAYLEMSFGLSGDVIWLIRQISSQKLSFICHLAYPWQQPNESAGLSLIFHFAYPWQQMDLKP